MSKQIKASLDEIVEAVINAEFTDGICDCTYCQDKLRTALEKLSGNSGYVEWVSVKDRLPTPFMEVLVTDGIEVRSGFYDSEFSNMVMRKKYQFNPITHWMPLPKPPKKGGESYWFCAECNIEVDGINVTFQELHQQCGTRVIQKGDEDEG